MSSAFAFHPPSTLPSSQSFLKLLLLTLVVVPSLCFIPLPPILPPPPPSSSTSLPSLPPSLSLPPTPLLSGQVTLPGSKSLSNRILLLSALSSGTTRVTNLLASDDTSYMLSALRQLGVRLRMLSDTECEVEGVGGPIPVPDGVELLNLGNAGTAMRPLAAALCWSAVC